MKKIITSIIFISIAIFFLVYSNDQAKVFLKSYIPLDVKKFIKHSLFKNDDQDKKIQTNFDILNKLNTQVSILEHKLDTIEFKKQIQDNGYFVGNAPQEINFNNELKFEIFKTPFYSWHINEKMTSYIEIYDETYILTTGDGYFFKGSLTDLINKKLIIRPVETNIDDIINNKLLKEIYLKQSAYSHAISVKDTLVYNDSIYMSLVDEIRKNCFMTSVLKAKINKDFENLNFEYFYKPKFCLENKDNTALIISGGAIEVNTENKKLYLSIGDYRHWDTALKPDSILGKVLEIDLITKEYEIYSSGHRNPLSILFDNDNQILLSTEMGPHYGDEINLLKKGKNYGWPVSSYGLHYSDYTGESPLAKIVNLAPLYKSHKDYNFEEPLFSFSPYFDKKNTHLEKLVGGPALKNIEKNIFSTKNNSYLVFGMKAKKMYLFDYINDVLELNKTLNIGFRVRDVKNVKDFFLLTEEEGPNLIILKKNN